MAKLPHLEGRPARVTDHSLNRLVILKAIRRHAPLTRSELPALTSLSSGMISQVTGELVRREILIEAKEHTPKRAGRPRRFLQINSDGATVVAGSLTDNGLLETAFVDLTGRKLFSIDVPLGKRASLEQLSSAIAEAFEEAIAASPFEAGELRRIGLTLPGLVDSSHGILYQIASFPAATVPVAEIIRRRIGLPVTIENTMTCMARSEHWFGRAQNLENFTLVFVGFSVGSAEYAGGLPRFGANGINSELGHVKTVFGPKAPACFCGQRGCIAAISGMYGMAKAWGRVARPGVGVTSDLAHAFDRLVERAEAGNDKARTIIERAGEHLGIAIANQVNATDPGTVLVVTASAQLRDLLAEKVRLTIERNVLSSILRRTDVRFEIVDPDWRWKGTAALGLEKFYLDDADDPRKAEVATSQLE